MGTVPTPRTWVDKEIPPYSLVNDEIYDTLSWLLQPPMCKVRQTNPQTITSGTETAIQFQAEDIDPYNWFHTDVSETRVTPTFPGYYRGWYSVAFPVLAAGSSRWARLAVSNSATGPRSRRDARPYTASPNGAMRGIPFVVPLNGTTDYVELHVLIDNGTPGTTSNLPTGTYPYLQSELFIRWLAPL